MINFQKIYGLYGLKHHTMEINGDVTMETTISENRASQQIDQGLLTFAITGTFKQILRQTNETKSNPGLIPGEVQLFSKCPSRSTDCEIEVYFYHNLM